MRRKRCESSRDGDRDPLVAPKGVLVAALLVFAGLAVPFSSVAETGESVESEIESLQQEIDDESASGDAGSASDARSDVAEDGAPSGDGSDSATPAGETMEELADDAGGRADAKPEQAAVSFFSLYYQPILCAVIAGAILGLLGVYVVARRIVFVTAALSQVSALGITLGFLVVGLAGLGGLVADVLPVVAAIGASLAVVFALTRVGETDSFPRDAVLGTAFVGPMALVLVLGPYIPREMHEIQAVLHGSAVVVRTADLWAIAVAGLVVVGFQVVGFRGFVFASLDPTVARTQGLPVDVIDAVLFGSIAVMVGLSTRALGALPTFALTVLPAIGAMRLEVGLPIVFAASAVAGALSGGVGYGLAYVTNWSVGASQALVAGGAMVVLRFAGRLTAGRDRDVASV